MKHLRHINYNNLRGILLGTLRGTTLSEIGYSLGMHHTHVKAIKEEPVYESLVKDVETFLMGGQLDEKRKKKNAILLKSLQMSHLNNADLLKTAQSLSYDLAREKGEHSIHISMEDVNHFKEYYGIEF